MLMGDTGILTVFRLGTHHVRAHSNDINTIYFYGFKFGDWRINTLSTGGVAFRYGDLPHQDAQARSHCYCYCSGAACLRQQSKQSSELRLTELRAHVYLSVI